MSTLPTIEKAQAYLNVHFTHAAPHGVAHSAGPFITISRESGTRGTTLAEILLRQLPTAGDEHPWAIYSGNLIEEMLRTNDLPPRLAQFLPEDRISEFNAAVGEIVGLHPNLWDLVVKTNDLIRRIARAGHAIILGRGANFVTADIAHGVHVRLVARPAHRAACTARRFAMSQEDALVHNSLRDAARQRYVRATFGTNIADPNAYTVVANTESLSHETIADLVTALARQHAAVPAG